MLTTYYKIKRKNFTNNETNLRPTPSDVARILSIRNEVTTKSNNRHPLTLVANKRLTEFNKMFLITELLSIPVNIKQHLKWHQKF